MELKDLKIELRPHIGKKQSVIGGAVVEVPVDFKQCYVMANGKQVGWYCGRKDEKDKYLSFIQFFPANVQEAIAAEVAKITGGVGKFNSPPPDDHDSGDSE